ncbi:hypothetical protein B0J12DRAFT_611813 [Macrophomina phaseolina]|uniref:ER-bound oxygenase mpaB/mpaB'/Rubber oxygenase catalytic domain-containing protein n=1 Tax=Macrophomina phaseolina TaxID=35725 RepID=A0ABQ8FPT7_9PEZI|nr:hypothetical protein B0J12DRAFT_611813 [Macrophomina phaseolina]
MTFPPTTFDPPKGYRSWEEFHTNPWKPLPPAVPKRPVPQWPPPEQRKGKWVSKYLDTLDPETEYDQIIRTATFFGPPLFVGAVGYATTFCILTQPANSAAAIHFGARVVRRGHQRFYETYLHELEWVYHGSSSPETAKDIDKVNRMHANIWKHLPGTYSDPYEANMSVISMGFLEQYLRKLVGARNEMHPKVRAAWPEWGQRVCDHFHTEPSDGMRSMGLGFPRTFEELGTFWYRFDAIPWEGMSTPELIQKGRETAEAFINQFCDLWFPYGFHWLGRQLILVTTPPNCRRRQNMGEPNWIVSPVIKFVIKVFFDLSDSVLPDAKEPVGLHLRERLSEMNLNKMDRQVKMYRSRQRKAFMVVGLLIGWLLCMYFLRILYEF